MCLCGPAETNIRWPYFLFIPNSLDFLDAGRGFRFAKLHRALPSVANPVSQGHKNGQCV